MTATTRTNLYQFFMQGDRPTAGQFADLIDSSLNIADTSGQFITSDVSCGGKFDVSGAFTVNNSAQTNLSGNLIVSGNTTLTGPVSLGGNLTINNLTVVSAFTGNTISISGPISAASINLANGINAQNIIITTSGSPSAPAIQLPSSAGLSMAGTAIVFSTNNNEVARINGSGNFLIGTTVDNPFGGAGFGPGAISVDLGTSTTRDGIEIVCGTNSFVPAVFGFNNSVVGNCVVFVSNTTIVGGISTDGTTTSFNTISDLRKKELLSDYDPDELFDHLKVWNFNWKSNNKRDVGCIAQELYELVPSAVSKGDDVAKEENETGFDSWQISYPSLVPYLIAEIKALRRRLKSLEDK